MATEFVVLLPQSDGQSADAVLEALEMLDAIEQRLTAYSETSEVARVNRLAFEQPVEVSAATYDLLKRAVWLSELTDGAFDITAGPLIHAWGFMTRSGKKPSDREIESALSKVGYQKIQLDDNSRTVRLSDPGMSINLGAIGKGDALDRLTERLVDHGVENFLLHGGNSSVVARGHQTPDSEQGWAVGLAHPTKPRRRVGGLWLRDQSLATSGSGKQFFHHRGKRYGHVIDPRTGYPAGDLLSLSVVTESATNADALATGMFVAGSQAVSEWPNESRIWSGLIEIAPGRRQDEVTVQSSGETCWVED